MAEDRPLWRRLFDNVEQQVAPRLEAFVRTDQFADLAALMQRLRIDLERRAERASRQQWHRWNLPTGTDVKRLSEQIASLERRVRDLSQRLEERGSDANGQPSQPSRTRRSNST